MHSLVLRFFIMVPYVTHVCQMYSPILINWTNPFPILRLLVFFIFFNRALCTQLVENLIRNRVAASDLVLLRLPMAQAYMG